MELAIQMAQFDFPEAAFIRQREAAFHASPERRPFDFRNHPYDLIPGHLSGTTSTVIAYLEHSEARVEEEFFINPIKEVLKTKAKFVSCSKIVPHLFLD